MALRYSCGYDFSLVEQMVINKSEAMLNYPRVLPVLRRANANSFGEGKLVFKKDGSLMKGLKNVEEVKEVYQHKRVWQVRNWYKWFEENNFDLLDVLRRNT